MAFHSGQQFRTTKIGGDVCDNLFEHLTSLRGECILLDQAQLSVRGEGAIDAAGVTVVDYAMIFLTHPTNALLPHHRGDNLLLTRSNVLCSPPH